MPAAPLAVSAALALATGVGAATLALAPEPLTPSAALLVVIGAVGLSLAASAGVLLARGRWSRRLGAGLAAGWAVLGAVLDSAWGWLVIAAAAAALLGFTGPWLGRWVRHLPRSDGAPPAAVVALLVLVATPAALGFSAPGGAPTAAWVLSAWCWTLALGLARLVPGSLTAARIVHPAVAVAAAWFMTLAAAVVAAGSGVAVAALCWRRDVTRAIVPLVPLTGSTLRLPPELAPAAILEAAGADPDGRRMTP